MAIPIDGGDFNVWHRPPAPGYPTAVLLHGLTSTSRWWLPVISHLPDELGLIAVDIRGRGRSWDSPGPYDVETIADDIGRAMDALQVDVCVVAGYSMGAWIAAIFANAHPERVSRVVLVDGGLRLPYDGSLTAEQALHSMVGPAVERLSMTFDISDDYYEFWRQHPALAGSWSDSLREVLNYELAGEDSTWRLRTNPLAVMESGRGIVTDDATNNAGAQLKVPGTLVIVDHGTLGQSGGFTPFAAANLAAEANPNISVRMLEDLNHYTLMLGQGARQVAQVIKDGNG